MSKGTRLKVYSIRVEMTDFITGRNAEDALEHYKIWLSEHSADWKLLGPPELKGDAWEYQK